jgi:Arc/MetJ-type ribon-helix-helix transcriptional regulator
MANKEKIITLRVGDEEVKMLKDLKGHPFFINISEYLRACIKHLYKTRMSKAGRVAIDKTSLPPTKVP